LECLVNRPRLDSTIQDQKVIIQEKDTTIVLVNDKLTVCTEVITQLHAENEKLHRNKKWLQIGIGTFAGIAIFEAIILLIVSS